MAAFEARLVRDEALLFGMLVARFDCVLGDQAPYPGGGICDVLAVAFHEIVDCSVVAVGSETANHGV